ncbi:MAG TPA: hypothetical protein VKB76_07115 [Ktedonobacterales bacterium]|nr:hypothetical protein [Ktedonobacterales bacterium]
MTRQMFVDRLRAWAARAENEVAYSKGYEKIAWQGQSAVLRATASVAAAGSAIDTGPAALRRQLLADRQKALAAWEAADNEADASLHSGETAGYDLILALLSDNNERWAS